MIQGRSQVYILKKISLKEIFVLIISCYLTTQLLAIPYYTINLSLLFSQTTRPWYTILPQANHFRKDNLVYCNTISTILQRQLDTIAPRDSSSIPSTTSARLGNYKIVVSTKEIKVPILDFFNSNCYKLKLFLTQIELYLQFNIGKFTNEVKKMLQVILLLRGIAYKQIKLFVDNFLANYNSANKKVFNIFQSWKNRIKKKLEMYFGNSNAKYKVACMLLILYQKDLVA